MRLSDSTLSIGSVRPVFFSVSSQHGDHSSHCSGHFHMSLFFTECLTFLTQATYQKLLPLYFPRSLKEESHSLPYLPADIGNAEGEPVVPERQIRISEKPGASEGECWNSNFLSSLISMQIMGFLAMFLYRYGIYLVICITHSSVLLFCWSLLSKCSLPHTLSCYIFIKSRFHI